jgi:hypothetical protein
MIFVTFPFSSDHSSLEQALLETSSDFVHFKAFALAILSASNVPTLENDIAGSLTSFRSYSVFSGRLFLAVTNTE